MILLLFIVTVITTVFYVYEYLTRNFSYWKTRKVIGPKPVLIFGNIADIALCKLTQAECLQNIYRYVNNERRSLVLFPCANVLSPRVNQLVQSPRFEFCRKYEGEKYVGMFQLSTPTLLVLDPQLIKQILVKDFHHFTDRGFAYDDKREPLTANLINLGGVTWKVLRQKLTPAFSSGKIKNMMPLLHDCSDQLLDFVQVNSEN